MAPKKKRAAEVEPQGAEDLQSASAAAGTIKNANYQRARRSILGWMESNPDKVANLWLSIDNGDFSAESGRKTAGTLDKSQNKFGLIPRYIARDIVQECMQGFLDIPDEKAAEFVLLMEKIDSCKTDRQQWQKLLVAFAHVDTGCALPSLEVAVIAALVVKRQAVFGMPFANMNSVMSDAKNGTVKFGVWRILSDEDKFYISWSAKSTTVRMECPAPWGDMNETHWYFTDNHSFNKARLSDGDFIDVNIFDLFKKKELLADIDIPVKVENQVLMRKSGAQRSPSPPGTPVAQPSPAAVTPLSAKKTMTKMKMLVPPPPEGWGGSVL